MSELLKLTQENYFSPEAQKQYMGVSMYKGFLECEAKEMAKLNGLYQEEKSTAFLVGSYFHAHFDNTLGTFKKENPDIFKKDGSLKAEYQQANQMIQTLENDEFCMYVMEGESEVIMSAELFGIPWKIKMDRYNKEKRRFVDIKSTRDFERVWDPVTKQKVTFVELYGYLIQMAVYREIEYIATGAAERMDGLMVAVTKQDPPDKAVISFYSECLDSALLEVENNIQRIIDVKAGIKEPIRCGKCAYCRSVKKISKIIDFSEL